MDATKSDNVLRNSKFLDLRKSTLVAYLVVFEALPFRRFWTRRGFKPKAFAAAVLDL